MVWVGDQFDEAICCEIICQTEDVLAADAAPPGNLRHGQWCNANDPERLPTNLSLPRERSDLFTNAPRRANGFD